MSQGNVTRDKQKEELLLFHSSKFSTTELEIEDRKEATTQIHYAPFLSVGDEWKLALIDV